MNNDKYRTVKSTRWPLAIAFLTILTGVCAANTGLSENADECKERMLEICSTEQYKFTPKVRDAFLDYAKAQAKSDLQAQGKSLPDEFLAWIDSDPTMEASVYGSRQKASDVLLMLYSLRLDLGKADFEKYRQLVMATAVVHAKLGPEANVRSCQPLKLVIGGDPRKLVDTKKPGRALDINDHIINFLNDNTIEEEVEVYKEVLPELKYDDRGVAIPAPKGKAEKVKVTEKRTRSLYAADVLASKALQEKFNAYMKSKGHDVSIDCGERIVHWKSRDMVRGEQNKKIHDAYMMFKTAYEAKGLLPAERDPTPSPGERCAYLIRNDKYRFSPEVQKQRKWPRFPLTAPWPVLTMLVADNQPLREREERWNAFRDDGVFKTYGEYIGSVAQQYDMQSARRIKPHSFTYGSIQMMLKDGGVCGTMGNISARSHNTLGIPACTAGQPGHCAMVFYHYDPKSETYTCRGGQYATGGHDKTTPHTLWYFGDVDTRKGMVYHQSIAWVVNYGIDAYLDSNLAHAVFRQLSETDQETGGLNLLESGLEINPYNFLLTDAWLAEAPTPQEQIRFWKFYKEAMAAIQNKPDCPAEGLYNKTVKSRMFKRIAEIPAPKNKQTIVEVLAFLQEEQCDVPAAVVNYRFALKGVRPLMAGTAKDFREYLETISAEASHKNYLDSVAMAATIRAVADHIDDTAMKKKWGLFMWQQAKGNEKYFGNKYQVYTESSLPYLAKLAGEKMPSEARMMAPILSQVSSELKKSVAGERNIKDCKQLATKINSAGHYTKDQKQKRMWLEMLSKVMAGHETFQPKGAKANAKPLRDPCSDVIKQLLESLETA